MSFIHSHDFTINGSSFYDIRGDYHYNTMAPGERGMILPHTLYLYLLSRQ